MSTDSEIEMSPLGPLDAFSGTLSSNVYMALWSVSRDDRRFLLKLICKFRNLTYEEYTKELKRYDLGYDSQGKAWYDNYDISRFYTMPEGLADCMKPLYKSFIRFTERA
jgi:hypothetical protein